MVKTEISLNVRTKVETKPMMDQQNQKSHISPSLFVSKTMVGHQNQKAKTSNTE